MKVKQILHAKKGFTLTEALVAGAIIVVVSLMMVLGFGGMTGLATHATQFKQDSAAAARAAAYEDGTIVVQGCSINIGYGVEIQGNIVRYSVQDGTAALEQEEGEATLYSGAAYYTFEPEGE